MSAHSFNGNVLARALLVLAIGAGMGAAGTAFATQDDATGTEAHSDSAGVAITDSAITARVKARFLDERGLESSKIHVTTTNGVVTLTGIANPSAQDVAVQLARGVKGVRSVDSELRSSADPSATERVATSTEKGVSDDWITTKVKSALLTDDISRGFDVHVTTHHGVVLLDGRLPNRDAVAHVRDVAQKIDGVKSVDINGLTTDGG